MDESQNQLILAPIMKLSIKGPNKFLTMQCVSVHAMLLWCSSS
nr:MAG TPA: hypothetical protein [Caudoviricetes sp.]